MMPRAALGNSATEKPLGTRHREQGTDTHTASRFTRDGDIVGVATKGGTVLLHPQQGRDLIEQSQVDDAIAESKKAIDAEAVVDGHADDPVTGKARTVIGRNSSRAIGKGTAVYPDEHRQFALRGGRSGSPDIEV